MIRLICLLRGHWWYYGTRMGQQFQLTRWCLKCKRREDAIESEIPGAHGVKTVWGKR